MKKFLLSLLMIKTALASQFSISPSPFNGAYGGLGLSNTFLIGKFNAIREDVNIRYVKLANNKLSPEVFAGFGGLWGTTPLYIGFEGFGAYHRLDFGITRLATPENVNANKAITIKNTLGGVGRFGITTKDFLIALRLGMAYSNFHAKYRDYEGLAASEGSNKWGKVAGAEIGYVVYPNWIASIKYDYITYNNLKMGHDTLDFSYKPVVHSVGLRLAHSF